MQHHPAPFITKIYKGEPGYGHGIAIFSAESNTAIARVHAHPNTYPFADENNVNDSACEATARLFRESPRMLLFLHEISERKDIPRDARNAALTLLNMIGLAPNITNA